jgi:hypothetical protein
VNFQAISSSYHGRLLLGVLLLFGVIPVIGLLLGRCFQRAFDGYTAGIYIGTGIAVLWYTVETYYLRQEMVRQNEIAAAQLDGTIQPLLVSRIEIERDPVAIHAAYPAFVLRNIGHGPAIFVQLEAFDLHVRMKGVWRVTASTVDVVEPGKTERPSLAATLLDTGGTTAMPTAEYPDLVASLRDGQGHAVATYTLVMRYEDVQKRHFESVMQMGQDGTRLLGWRRL